MWQNPNKAVCKVVGNRIRELRIQRDIAQLDLASLLGVSWDAMKQIESGEDCLDIAILFEIAHYLECSLHDLIPEDW